MIPMPDFPPDPASLTPQTTVKLYYGVPWDNTYKHVRLYRDDQNRQFNLSSRLFREVTSMTYVKMGTLTLEIDANEMLASQCNYLSFQNLPIDNRWHYAFIKSVKPTSVNSVQIEFELDVFQECIFEINRSTTMYVDRCHIKRSEDTVGANTLPENFELGGYEVWQNQTIPALEDDQQYDIVFATTFDENGNVVEGGRVGGVYSAMDFRSFESVADANAFIKSITENNLLDGIVECFMVPHFATQGVARKSVSVPFTLNASDYTPRNNKLLTYPYNYIYATNNCGTSVDYRFEWFSDPNAILFYYNLPLTTNPTLIAYPRNYKNLPENLLESISFNNYPTCALAIDSYKAWLAQSGSGRAVEALTNMFNLNLSDNTKGLLQVGVDMFLKNGLRTFTDPLGTISNTLQQQTAAYVQAPGSKNNISNTIYHAMSLDHITLYHVQIREEYMRLIDDYWTMFGYPQRRLMVPELENRTFWDYVKTVDCSFKGSVETNMLSQFRQIFDNGVTIWHVEDVGNYSLPN